MSTMETINNGRKPQVNKSQVKKARSLLSDKIKISKYITDNNLGYADHEVGKINCPMHNENTPSFIYDDNKGLCNCFGCGRGGTVVELHYHIKSDTVANYSYIKAMYDLSKMYNVELPNLFKYQPERIKRKPMRRVRSRGRKEQEKLKEQRYISVINRANKQYIQSSTDNRLKIGYLLDEYYLGEATAKDTYLELNRIRKQLQQDLFNNGSDVSE